MYRFEVYKLFNNGSEFVFLTTYACYGKNREDAKAKALEWAKATYPNYNVDVMCAN